MIYYKCNQTSLNPRFKPITINEIIDYFKDKKIIEVDTETEGEFNFKNRILLLQLGDSENQFVLNFNDLTKNEKDLLTNKLFNTDKYIKLFHNAKFDIKFLWFEGFKIKCVYDTMLAEKLLKAGINLPVGSLSLLNLVKTYC